MGGQQLGAGQRCGLGGGGGAVVGVAVKVRIVSRLSLANTLNVRQT